MAFFGDYHTHTTFSHGKATMEENVVKAISLGLKEIATTDHGFKHMTYHVRRQDWSFILKERARLREKYPEINIMLGIETNITGLSGGLDIEEEDLDSLDILVAGYHKFVKPHKIKDLLFYFWPNFISDTFGKTSQKLIARNTDVMIKVLENYPIDIFSHPQYGLKIDSFEVFKAAANYGTYYELNGKRIMETRDGFEKLLSHTNIEFVANSDSHHINTLGDFSLPQKVIDEVGIPLDRIANWKRLPSLRSRKNKEKLN